MYLYERNENKADKVDKVDVYSFIPDEDRLTFYRKRIINSSDIDKMFCCLEINNSTIFRRFVDGDTLDVRFLEHKDKNGIVSLIHDRPTEYDQLELLDNYVKGKYSDISPTITFIPEDAFDCFLEAYLSPWPLDYKIISKDNKDYYCLDNIIRLPIELCRLQLLLNGKFDVINYFNSISSDIDEQLNYFLVEKISSSSIQKLENKLNRSDLKNRIPETEKILRKIRCTR